MFTIVAIESPQEVLHYMGTTDPVLFDYEFQAFDWLVSQFGDEAGKEYLVVNVSDL